jgi:hypothetical protein
MAFDITGNTPIVVTSAMADATSMTQNFTIPMTTITINVVDADGNPVPGAQITLPDSITATLPDFYNGDESATGTVYPGTIDSPDQTDANGNYLFYNLIGADPATGTVTPPAGGTPVTFALPTPTSTAGTITVQLPATD